MAKKDEKKTEPKIEAKPAAAPAEAPKKKEKRQGFLMGIFDIIPGDNGTNEEIIEKVKVVIRPFKAEIMDFKVEEVAFGAQKIIARVVFPDNIEGGTQPIEDAMMTLEGFVERVECGIPTILQ